MLNKEINNILIKNASKIDNMEEAFLNIFSNIINNDFIPIITKNGILVNIKMAIGIEKYQDWIEQYKL
jgi:uncharacterized Fe-S cluster-containing MiaB family protein